MKNNIILQFLVLLVVITITITAISLYNLRTVSVKSSISSAESISEVIKSGLTSHMVNNNMKDINTFLSSVSNIKNVKDIWLVRSDLVNNQFNTKGYQLPKDSIDRDVLATGKMRYAIDESYTDTSVRVTIPYNAKLHKGINCLECHNVKENSTLGAVSIILDVSTLKEVGLKSIYIIFAIILATIIIIFLFTKKVFNPYLKLYLRLRDNIKEAKLGKFNNIDIPKGVSSDMNELSLDYNNLISIFKDTSSDIEEKLQGFIGYRNQSIVNNNPLNQSKEIIDNLSNLYQFKKQVELDHTKDEIYNRIAEIFKNKFQLKNFTFFEIDRKKSKMTKVIKVGESLYCYEGIASNPELCRAARTKNDIVSIDFHSSCPYFNKNDKLHYCINIDIVESLHLIVHLVCDTQEELEEIKNKSLFIKRYLKEASPSIEVKLLMNALQESAFTDGLTGLYNRKYLDVTLKTLIPQVKRDKKNIGLLMLDMDHFKAVNDEYGHDIGDKVLKELSRILTETLRESDIIIRYGGEEFMVLLIGVDSEESALIIANKIGQKVRENEIDVYAGTTIRKTISSGLSMYPQDSNSFDTIIKNADIALYEAKSSGRDKVVRFTKEQVTSVELF